MVARLQVVHGGPDVALSTVCFASSQHWNVGTHVSHTQYARPGVALFAPATIFRHTLGGAQVAQRGADMLFIFLFLFSFILRVNKNNINFVFFFCTLSCAFDENLEINNEFLFVR